MGRSHRLALAILGLVSLVGWWAYVWALDARLIHRLQLRDTVFLRPTGI